MLNFCRFFLSIFPFALLPGCSRAEEPIPVAQPRCHFSDPRLTEISGLAASRRFPGCLWTHNDSGDSARVFLVNPQGETVATINLEGASATDWEDISVAGSGQNAQIYAGDIGDNAAKRDSIAIYRLGEPMLDASKIGQEKSVKAEKLVLRYPDGPRDAETLAAMPDGRLLIVSKNVQGSSFYLTPEPFRDGARQILRKIGGFRFGATGVFTRLATGGDFSPDGRHLAITTYAQIYQWDLAEPFDCLQIEKLTPKVESLPAMKQCEAVCYNLSGDKLLVSSEGENAPLWELDFPQHSPEDEKP